MRYFTWLASFLCSAFFVVYAQTTQAEVIVKHLNATTSTWEEEHIPNMDSVFKIYSAGKYAWAIDSTLTKVAFYDGNKWNDATTLPFSVNSLAPAYPFTGKTPTAWIVGENQKGDYYLAYFNGTSWIITQTGLSSDYNRNKLLIKASAGYAWLQLYHLSGQAEFYQLAPNDPLKLHSILSDINLSLVDTVVASDSFNDTNANYFVLIQKLREGPQLLKVDANGNIISTNLKRTLGIDRANMFVKGNDIILLTYKGLIQPQQRFVYYSRDNGVTWSQPIVTPEDIIFNSSSQFYKNYSDGIFYGNTRDQFQFKPIERFIVSLNEINPTWQSLPIPSEYIDTQVISDSTGAWLMSRGHDSRYILYHYNAKTKQLTNMYPDAPSEFSSGGEVRIINNMQALVCANYTNPTMYYFNGFSWSSQPINLGFCHFSHKGGSNNELDSLDKESVWVY